MSDEGGIIARCTRNGVTSWQNVAAQMGRSVDSVRAEFDPRYLHVRPWPHPCESVEPEVDVEDTSSPFPKGQGMKARILALLERQSMSAEQLSGFLHSPVNSVRARLDRLLEAGRVCHDGAFPRTWGLLEADGKPRRYASGTVTLWYDTPGQSHAQLAVTKRYFTPPTAVAATGRKHRP